MSKKRICERGLNRIQIIDHKGNIRICSWIADGDNGRIGTLSQQSLNEIYHGKRANELRERMFDGDYSMCNIDSCPFLAMDILDEHIVEVDEVPEYPEGLYLAFENVCNYSCTSCNIHDIMLKNKLKDIEKGYDKIEEQIKDIMPHLKTISANGLGELFCSKRTLRLLSEWRPLAPAEEISVYLETNGSLFDEKHWKQIENLEQYHLSVAITVMSFEESTYQFLSGTKLPITQIENNLHFVKKLRKQGVVDYFEIATVVQERNFREMPEFARKCIEEYAADYVRLRPYEPWGSMDPEMEWFTDIRNPKHPHYEEYKKVMENEIFKHPCVHDWSGGRDTANIKEYPYLHSYFREKVLMDIVFNIDGLVKKLKDAMEHETLIIYGIGNIGKVLLKQLSEKNIHPIYILDKYKSCDQYKDIKVYNLKENRSLEREADILITPLWESEEIKQDLKCSGYNGKLILIKDLLEDRVLMEELYGCH